MVDSRHYILWHNNSFNRSEMSLPFIRKIEYFLGGVTQNRPYMVTSKPAIQN